MGLGQQLIPYMYHVGIHAEDAIDGWQPIMCDAVKIKAAASAAPAAAPSAAAVAALLLPLLVLLLP